LSVIKTTSLPDIYLRGFEERDVETLFKIYQSTRHGEMSLIPHWSAEQKQAFLRSQFQAQHSHYQHQFPKASYDLILKGENPIGRFYVDRLECEYRIIDIALLPEYSNRGIGGALIRELQEQARGDGKQVTLHVEKSNHAKRLYDRLGFTIVGEIPFYWLMEWKPE